VQAAIQGDQLRVSGKNKDDLQAVMQVLREADLGIDMQFTNRR
jgi:cyclic-di-GMP-binding protein